MFYSMDAFSDRVISADGFQLVILKIMYIRIHIAKKIQDISVR